MEFESNGPMTSLMSVSIARIGTGTFGGRQIVRAVRWLIWLSDQHCADSAPGQAALDHSNSFKRYSR